ncbi:MAG: hypothetical protein Ct9H300mP18_09410 [Candidatus Neomarinimicrobiota bacterium]|nr:MAG: hypothetical protein Ct9H300mP18_09410 [Candidatus Neomarinimicrobiota bacterium]
MEKLFWGYYHDDDYGFGHWANQMKCLEKNLALGFVREGGIWEDHLTDTDGNILNFKRAGQLGLIFSWKS